MISPSSGTTDRRDNFDEYRQAKGRHYWLADPEHQATRGWELRRGKYVLAGEGANADVIRLSPFAELDLPLPKLWRPALRRRRP